MNNKIGFFLLLAAGVAVPSLSSTALSAGLAGSSGDRKALLEELSKACLSAVRDRDHKKLKNDCECLVRYHSVSTEDRYLKTVIDAYAGRGNFNTSKISDEISIVLNNDADALEKCEKDPNWLRDLDQKRAEKRPGGR